MLHERAGRGCHHAPAGGDPSGVRAEGVCKVHVAPGLECAGCAGHQAHSVGAGSSVGVAAARGVGGVVGGGKVADGVTPGGVRNIVRATYLTGSSNKNITV